MKKRMKYVLIVVLAIIIGAIIFAWQNSKTLSDWIIKIISSPCSHTTGWFMFTVETCD